MRIVLADDEEKVRSALRLLVEELAQELTEERQGTPCRVVEAASAEAVVRELGHDRADLVLLDWELPGMASGDLVGRVRELSPGCVVIAMSGRPEAARDAVERGADAFVSKNEPPDRLVGVLLGRVAV
jgi:DNA-binding NarL/FixJ family response regulator